MSKLPNAPLSNIKVNDFVSPTKTTIAAAAATTMNTAIKNTITTTKIRDKNMKRWKWKLALKQRAQIAIVAFDDIQQME